MSISEELVTLIRNRSVRPEDQRAASLFFLDALACAYAGAQTEVGQKLIAWSRNGQMNTRTQTFLMGALAHITETDDLHRASVTHPGCIVIPAVLATSQQTRASGEAILAATLGGFEAMCRIGRAVGPAHYQIWHNTATCGPFGSAMAVSQLLGLSGEQCVHALGNAGTQSSGFWQFLESGAMSKHLHAGRAAESGLLAAELAHFDFTGASDILEGEKGLFKAMCPDAHPDAVLADEHAPWELTQTSIKPWPSCRHTHPVIDAALELQAQLGNAVIEKVDIGVYQAALNICDRETVENEYQAKFSLQHCAAMALMNGAVSLDSFSSSARAQTTDLCARTNVRIAEEVDGNYPKSWGAELTLSLADGRELSAKRRDCFGDPELPLSDDEMTEKAKHLLGFGRLSSDQASALCNAVLGLPTQKKSTVFMNDFLAHIM